jgi:3-phenylpropionate/cinnamic acid dioxygenase small subunit
MSLREEIEQFLYHEARLMDEHRFEEWEALWADDGVYWVPCAHDGTPDTDVALIYADRAALTRRLLRMKSGAMYIQDPRSVLARLVGNVEIYPEGDAAARVHSTFNITEFRRRGHKTWLRTWAGRSEHHLRRVDADWKMAFKKVLLVNSDGEPPALGFLV